MKITILLSFCILFSLYSLNAQINVITVDSVSGALSNVVPYDKTFKIKLKLQEDDLDISYVRRVKKVRYKDLSGSLKRNPVPIELPRQYYQIKKLGTSSFLIITIADTFLLKPSTGYYFIVGYKKLDNTVFNFFQNYYIYSKEKDEKKKASYFEDACSNLDDFNNNTSLIFGENVSWDGLTSKEVKDNKNVIAKSFKDLLMKPFSILDSLSSSNDYFLKRQNIIPDLSGILTFLVKRDTTVTDQTFNFIAGKDYSNVSLVADLITLGKSNKTNQLVSGIINLDCIYCKPIDNNSKSIDDLNKRVANIDKTINSLNSIRRSIFLSNSKLKLEDKGIELQTFIDTLLESKRQMSSLIKIRKEIDATLLDSLFVVCKKKLDKDEDSIATKFSRASVIDGNSYLDFETRNKALLTPDFGIVTSSFFSQGENLDYGIVPYLGFHLNFMPVDKDLSFLSYKKDWKQRFSVMVGWSLVNMKNRDSTYTNFFEKSSLLTGIGFRLNNVIRITTGSQWLFKTKDSDNNPDRILQPIPFIGISFDLNIKQYLNGFTDLLSGIGKIKSPNISPNNTY